MNIEISVSTLPAIQHNNIPVVITELLAQLYGTDPIRIQQNYSRNEGRFVVGKHFIKLEGSELSVFRV
ncbi:ORF6N domain-containing protein [Yersinia enterocolitica]|uniref:ORF6N domain-containing protein n=1 Tax=Yersinia enterocolitica TaxID=630 RepID=UPI000977DD99|nr:ORF6N domain-containing protein [Yersinia enterocolitica]